MSCHKVLQDPWEAAVFRSYVTPYGVGIGGSADVLTATAVAAEALEADAVPVAVELDSREVAMESLSGWLAWFGKCCCCSDCSTCDTCSAEGLVTARE